MHDAWEGGRRQGLRWRRLAWSSLTAALIAGLVWGALRDDEGLQVDTDDTPVVGVPEEEQDVVVTAPQAAGDRWLCPRTHAVRSYDTGVYYPPQHPGAPPFSVRPDACYAGTKRAEDAGYELAQTPPGVVRAADFYLVRARRPTRAACAEVATTVGFAVPCPTLLPFPGEGASCLNSCLYSRGDDRFGVVIEQRGFPVPLGWCPGCTPHVVVTAVHDQMPSELISCDQDMQVAIAAGDVVTGVFACGSAPPWLPGIGGFAHESHTLQLWRRGRVTYGVSLEGHDAGNREVVAAIVDGVELVGPAPRR